MLPSNSKELDRLRNEARSMVTKRASTSAAAAIVPVPGADIAADIAIMLELLPAINRKFGLSPEQIDQLDPVSKQQALVVITSIGGELVGKYITKELVAMLLKKVGTRVAVKSVTKFIPFIGQAVSASISFGAMKYLGNSHVDECYAVCKRILEKKE